MVQSDSGASFQGLVDDEVARIDWSRDAEEVDRLIRGCDPQPGAHAGLDDARVRLYDAQLLDEELAAWFEERVAEHPDFELAAPRPLNLVCFRHVGGDEVPRDRWRECPDCQERIRREGLRDEDDLLFPFYRIAPKA